MDKPNASTDAARLFFLSYDTLVHIAKVAHRAARKFCRPDAARIWLGSLNCRLT